MGDLAQLRDMPGDRASPDIVGERCVVMKHSRNFALTMARADLPSEGRWGPRCCRLLAMGGAEPGDGAEVRGGGDEKTRTHQPGAS
jgi:hypothetical protein